MQKLLAPFDRLQQQRPRCLRVLSASLCCMVREYTSAAFEISLEKREGFEISLKRRIILVYSCLKMLAFLPALCQEAD